MDEILNGKKVLVVDDTSVSRMLAADMLKTAGAEPLEAGSGEEALRIARTTTVDAFLLDVRMGDLNGIDLCRMLRAMPQYRSTPIIFVTAVDQREVLQWALEAGADDFIPKPLHAMVLRRRLANLMQKSTYLMEVESMSRSLALYVSPRTQEIARRYATSGALPPPERREVCVMFSDARGFTEMSQEMEPETVFELLSSHLAAQVDVVYRQGGYIDKYSGDGIMAVFDGPDMAFDCCRCALEILDGSRKLAAHGGSQAMRVGIGIHQGVAMVGNLGSADHLDYTIVGRTVNLAARLCGVASQSIVVSQAVRDAVGRSTDLAFTTERAASIRGFREPIIVYDLERA
jgi:class 3 adenylate cyclase